MRFNFVSYGFVGATQRIDVGKKSLAGGAEIYLYDLAKFLIKKGHEVKVIQALPESKKFEFDGIEIEGIKVPSFMGLAKRGFAYNFCWPKHVEKNAHVHMHQFFHAFPFGTGKMTGTCHGLDWDYPFIEGVNPLGVMFIRNLREFYAKYSVKHLGKVAANHTGFKKYFEERSPKLAEKIDVIFNYVDLETFNPKVRPKISEKIGKDKKIILFPRNTSFARGPVVAVRAMAEVLKKHPDCILMMLGSGDARQYVDNLAKELGISENIIMLGHKNHFTEMPGYFAAADAVIVPTLTSEGTSMSCLEAMATQKPVVVTPTGGLLDLVEHKKTGLICKKTPESLAENILAYLDDKSFRDRMAKNAHEYAKKNHNIKLWCKRYANFFEI